MKPEDVKPAALCKAMTPNEAGKDRPSMGEIKKTLEQFRALPPEDQDDLRKAYAASQDA